MHPGVVACPPSAAITEVAGLLADHRIHCAAVGGVRRGDAGAEQLVWALIDALDVVAAALRWDPARTAADLARVQPITVGWAATVASAARSMVDNGETHVVAVDPGGMPAGVLSTLDVLAICAVA
jgi:CBS domain-containing protein